MIAFVEGIIVEKDPTYVIIDVGGLGYYIKISLNTFSDIKEKDKCKLNTHLYVKEDAHTLFGFSDITEKKRFLQLISISGVGPSTALMVLSSLSSEELVAAIIDSDIKTITSVKGIGQKTAQRIILELKDKMSKEDLLDKVAGFTLNKSNTIKYEALSALTTLGFNKLESEKAVDLILKETSEEIKLEELIKLALKRA